MPLSHNSKDFQLKSHMKNWNRKEKVFYGSIIITGLILAIAIVFMQSKIQQVQAQMTKINTEMTIKQTELDDTKQAINELTRASRLKQIAEEAGLTFQNNNIGVAE